MREKKGRATDAATRTENSVTRIAKSNLSCRVMYASGVVFWPIIARKSDMIDGDDWREPEYAVSDNVFSIRYSSGDDRVTHREESVALREPARLRGRLPSI